MKFLILSLPLLLTLVACAKDPEAQFEPELMTAKELSEYSNANIILIGEHHDNPVHHDLQNQILQSLASQKRLTSVVFEQVDWTNQGILDQITRDNLNTLPKKLEWSTSGWPDYEMYRPLFETAVKARAKIIAGGLPKDRIPLLYKTSYEVAFSAAEVEKLKVRTPIDGVGQELLAKEIFEGHCKMIPEDHVQKMIPVQRARDAALVKGYLSEADRSGVTVFILGNGHARKEFGVPTLLREIDPKLKVWSIGLLEKGNETPPATAFDKTWVTEAAEREDPCTQMKAHMEKEKEKEKSKTEDAAPTDKEKSEAAPASEAPVETETQEAPATPPPPTSDSESEEAVSPNAESPASSETEESSEAEGDSGAETEEAAE